VEHRTKEDYSDGDDKMKLRGPSDPTLIKNKEGETFYFCRGHYWKADEEHGGWIPYDLAYGDDLTPKYPVLKCRRCGSDTVMRGLGTKCKIVYICKICGMINEAVQ
jgi:hypothetical protein